MTKVLVDKEHIESLFQHLAAGIKVTVEMLKKEAEGDQNEAIMKHLHSSLAMICHTDSYCKPIFKGAVNEKDLFAYNQAIKSVKKLLEIEGLGELTKYYVCEEE